MVRKSGDVKIAENAKVADAKIAETANIASAKIANDAKIAGVDTGLEGLIPEMDRWRVNRMTGVDSWMLPIVLNGVKTHALVDSGASCCLLSKSVYDKMSLTRYRLLEGGKTIRGVGNNTLATIGEMNVEVRLAGQNWPMKMHVSSETEPV